MVFPMYWTTFVETCNVLNLDRPLYLEHKQTMVIEYICKQTPLPRTVQSQVVVVQGVAL